MNRFDFNFEDNMDDYKELILQKTDRLIEEIKKDLFHSLCDDIEKWIFERFENVRRHYFKSVIDFLINEESTTRDRKKLTEWLTEEGFTQKTLRAKIYADNKEVIDKAIIQDINNENIRVLI